MTKKKPTIQDLAVMAMEAAVKKVVEKHKKEGRPLAVWEDGKVKYIIPK